MKKTFTPLVICLLIFSVAYAQIPNPSFENWTTYSMGEYPTSWNTSDSIYQTLGSGHSAVRETTDVCHLSNSIKLISVSGLATAPGVATNGRLTGISSVSGGSPFTAEPATFDGCLKYIPSGADSGRVSAFLLRRNGAVRDTIAVAGAIIHSTPAMTNFSYNFVYRDFVNLPDTILIVLSSGMGVNQTVAGSTLTVDNLSISGSVVGLSHNSASENISIYPQPAYDVLNINLPETQTAYLNYRITDIIGKAVMNGKINFSDSRIDINALSRGNYFITFQNTEGAIVFSSKFAVAK